MLGRGGWGRGVSASRGLGGPGSVGGRNVDRGGGGGAKAGKKGGNIARVRERERVREARL